MGLTSELRSRLRAAVDTRVRADLSREFGSQWRRIQSPDPAAVLARSADQKHRVRRSK